MLPLRAAICVLTTTLSVLLGLATEARAGDTVTLRLNRVQVSQARERDGDRPYFATIQFRSRLNVPGSTSVRAIEFAPHDWISKRAYRSGLPRGDHLPRGMWANIPWWMGRIQWRDVDVVDLRGPARTVLAEASNAEILGAIVFSFDNNNTPPHVIRNLMRDARQIVHRLLVEQVESGLALGHIAAGTTDVMGRQLAASGAEVGRRIMSGFKLVRFLFQFTAGSLFDPDVPTGVQIVVLPAVTGLGVTEGTARLGDLPTGPVDGSILIAPLEDRRETWTFQGSGARYRVDASIDRDTTPAQTPVTQLYVKIRTGADGLSSGSRVYVSALLRDGRTSEPMALPGPVPGEDGGRLRRLPLPRGTRLGDIAAIRVRYVAERKGPFRGHHTWAMDAIEVNYGRTGSGVLLAMAGSGRALYAFSQRRNVWEAALPERGPLALTPGPLRGDIHPDVRSPRR